MRTPIEPDVHPRGRYTPGQAAAILGIGRSSLVRYAHKGLIAQRLQKGSKRGYYLGSDLLNLWKII